MVAELTLDGVRWLQFVMVCSLCGAYLFMVILLNGSIVVQI